MKTSIFEREYNLRRISGDGARDFSRVSDNCFTAFCDTAMFCLTKDVQSEIDAAYTRGCRIFIVGKLITKLPEDALVYYCDNIHRLYHDILDRIFPSDKLFKIAVSGNFDRGLCALTVYSLLRRVGKRCLYIGENGVSADRNSFEKELPTAKRIRRHLHTAVTAGLEIAVIEVLDVFATKDIEFDLLILTDENADSDNITFKNSIFVSDFKKYKTELFLSDGVYPHAKIHLEDTVLQINSFGTNTAYTAALAYKVAIHLGVMSDDAANACKTLFKFGRREIIECQAAVIVDYAYDAEHLQMTLEAMSEYNPKRIICLVGAMGGRFEGRRSSIGQTAGRYSDICIITSDDPRHESQERIARHIMSGADGCDCEFVRIDDRANAIKHALSIRRRGDFILLAGKGHESTIDIKGVSYSIDERKIVTDFFNEKS